MNLDNLRTYMEDHIAGSVGALELLADLAATSKDPATAEEARRLREEIGDEQRQLKELLHGLGRQESTIKKAGAWMAEKVMRAKLHLSDDLGLLQALETLSMGVEGKLRLWRAIKGLDLPINRDQLETAALEQIDRLEALRLAAAKRAFA